VSEITRPALRYYGAKWRLAPWIIQHLPAHVCYVEPYGGSMAVLLRKPPAMFDVYNDLDGAVVNFFRTLRDRTEELIRAIHLTPYSYTEFMEAFEVAGDPVEEARRFYVRCWQAYHPGRPYQNTGWRRQHQNHRGKSVTQDWNDIEHLRPIVERLKNVALENNPALDVIRSYDGPDTLFYVDPPYIAATRDLRWRGVAYRIEMSDDEHRALADVLKGMQGKVVLSGYASPLYDELFGDWPHVAKEAQTNGAGKRVERLWFSANCENWRQLPLLESQA
jgi:DNA adenine methylase